MNEILTPDEFWSDLRIHNDADRAKEKYNLAHVALLQASEEIKDLKKDHLSGAELKSINDLNAQQAKEIEELKRERDQLHDWLESYQSGNLTERERGYKNEIDRLKAEKEAASDKAMRQYHEIVEYKDMEISHKEKYISALETDMKWVNKVYMDLLSTVENFKSKPSAERCDHYYDSPPSEHLLCVYQKDHKGPHWAAGRKWIGCLEEGNNPMSIKMFDLIKNAVTFYLETMKRFTTTIDDSGWERITEMEKMYYDWWIGQKELIKKV